MKIGLALFEECRDRLFEGGAGYRGCHLYSLALLHGLNVTFIKVLPGDSLNCHYVLGWIEGNFLSSSDGFLQQFLMGHYPVHEADACGLCTVDYLSTQH